MKTDKTLEEVIKKYSLVLDDVYLHKNGEWKIITSQGIKKIIAKEGFEVLKALVFCSQDAKTAVVKCSVRRLPVNLSRGMETLSLTYEAFGEVNPENNTWHRYPINVAEKRAESRAVLMMTGMYQDKWRGEDEADEMIQGAEILAKRKEQTASALSQTALDIESAGKKKTVSYKKKKEKAIDIDIPSLTFPDLKLSETHTVDGLVQPKPSDEALKAAGSLNKSLGLPT